MQVKPDSRSKAELIQALTHSEDLFHLLVSSLKDYAVFTLDNHGNIVSWNSGAEDIYGYCADEIVGQPVAILYRPEDIAQQIPAQDLSFLPQQAKTLEGWRVCKDSRPFLAQVFVHPLHSDASNQASAVYITRDISSRHKLEQRFRQVVESAPSAMVLVNQEGIIEMVNTQAERLFGYSRVEMLDKHVELLVPDNFSAHHPERRAAFFSNPHSRPMGKGRDLYARRNDGSEFPVEIGLNPIETDEGTKVLSAIVDISERKRMELRLRQVVDSAPNAMVMINPAGRIEMVNTQAERVFGYSRAELLDQTVEKLVPERFRGHHPNMRGSFFSDPHSRPMGKGRDLFALRKDGSEFPVEIGLNPIQTDEGTKVLSAIVDISERKQREQKIEAALEEKNILLGEIHHRVKNNLQIVHSLLDLQSTQITDVAVIDMLRDSQNRIRSMALIHQSLYQSNDFARVNFNSVLETLVPTLVQSYGMNHEAIQFSIDATDLLLPLNLAVPCGLVVNELITNALKHAFPNQRNGNILITLSMKDGKALLSVSDNGVGIRNDYDLENKTTLGLQLVSLLADQMNAELSIKRHNPTCFSLVFALEKNSRESK